MKAITFLLHTKQPLLATSLQGDPNSDVSFSYIPGSMIRGVLIGRYLHCHGLQSTDEILDESKFPDVKRLFFIILRKEMVGSLKEECGEDWGVLDTCYFRLDYRRLLAT